MEGDQDFSEEEIVAENLKPKELSRFVQRGIGLTSDLGSINYVGKSQQWLFDAFIPIKNKYGQVVGRINNFAQESLDLFGLKNLEELHRLDLALRNSPENERFWPYDPSVRVFMIDNNREPMYCCALVYDMPHRIKTLAHKEHKVSSNIWRLLSGDHPSTLVLSSHLETQGRPDGSLQVGDRSLGNHHQRRLHLLAARHRSDVERKTQLRHLGAHSESLLQLYDLPWPLWYCQLSQSHL